MATGYGAVIYVGSLANGAIYEANLRTGEGQILVPGIPEASSFRDSCSLQQISV